MTDEIIIPNNIDFSKNTTYTCPFNIILNSVHKTLSLFMYDVLIDLIMQYYDNRLSVIVTRITRKIYILLFGNNTEHVITLYSPNDILKFGFDIIFIENKSLHRIVSMNQHINHQLFHIFNKSVANDYANILPVFNYLYEIKYGIRNYICTDNKYKCLRKNKVISVVQNYSNVLQLEIINEELIFVIIHMIKRFIDIIRKN